MIQWDDLRFFLAAVRYGSFSGAAAHAGADTATVSRRVARLETAMKATLFVRSASGLKLTSVGRSILQECESMEAMAAKVGETAENPVPGTVRLSVSEGFGTAILAPKLAEFQSQNPGLTIELAANAGFLSTSTREVDMAVTLSAPNDSRLIIEPLAEYVLGLFTTDEYLQRSGKPVRIDDLTAHSVVGYVDDLLYAPELKYLDEILPGLRPKIASTSIQAQYSIIKNGGVGVLPKFLSQGLIRLFPNKVSINRKFWLSVHREIAETSRAKRVRRWLRSVVESETAASGLKGIRLTRP
ncbi:MAG: LysR family transcriptional regulator [Pseudomonadota bacterium]